MKYATPASFRTALEARIRNHLSDHQSRLRKEIVFDRVLARLTQSDPELWVVKGGFALDIRYGDAARSTKDLDFFFYGAKNAAIEKMLSLAASTSTDFFEFEVRVKTRVTGTQPDNAVSFHISARLDGRRFEDINVDMEIGETASFEIERLRSQEFLVFAGIQSREISIISLEQHLAEKIHAYSRRFDDDRENTRIKDIVDMVLICQFSQIDGTRLTDAIEATFRNRGVTRPSRLPLPPNDWKLGYLRMAEAIKLNPDLATGHAIASRFLDPVLALEAYGFDWSPESQTWVRDQSDQIAPLG